MLSNYLIYEPNSNRTLRPPKINVNALRASAVNRFHVFTRSLTHPLTSSMSGSSLITHHCGIDTPCPPAQRTATTRETRLARHNRNCPGRLRRTLLHLQRSRSEEHTSELQS